ncbi:MAG TPA: NAD(P)-binding domain-containing protein [Jiangellaceae bacterium]|nr:NAD(P)-binding domain-containing protein [Jiangellaceae bacterium]
MRIGILGTGQVGRTLASRLAELGHDVLMGARDPANPRAAEWAEVAGSRGSAGTFADAAAHGEVVINATAGAASLRALDQAGATNLAGRVLMDVSNPIAEVTGGSLQLTTANTDSLAEQIQRAYPDSRVVKTLNTVNASVMVDPGRLPEPHTMFLAGDDAAAKAVVRGILAELGWPAESIVDLGGLSAARGMEMYLPLWLKTMQALGTAAFNIRIVRAAE